jgi:hypothetical protein
VRVSPPRRAPYWGAAPPATAPFPRYNVTLENRGPRDACSPGPGWL